MEANQKILVTSWGNRDYAEGVDIVIQGSSASVTIELDLEQANDLHDKLSALLTALHNEDFFKDYTTPDRIVR